MDTDKKKWYEIEKPIVVFDVESVGLYGEGFSVALVVGGLDGVIREEFYAACDSWDAQGTLRDRAWLADNCLPHLPAPTHETPKQVRDAFWTEFTKYKRCGGELWAECGWPVEARFLSDCTHDYQERAGNGPFPLHEIVSLKMHLKGKSRVGDYLPNELPKHNPICDARRSFRFLIESKNAISALQSSS